MPDTKPGENPPEFTANGGGGFDYSKIWELLMPLLFGGVGGKYIDDMNARGMIQPKEAVAQAGQRRMDYKDMLWGQRQGNVRSDVNPQGINPRLYNQQTATQESFNRPVAPPTPYNPYRSQATPPTQAAPSPVPGGSAGATPGGGAGTDTWKTATGQMGQAAQTLQPGSDPGFGQVNPELMAIMMQMAMGRNRNPQIGWGGDILQQSMANRFGSRNMQGTLTPRTLPGG